MKNCIVVLAILFLGFPVSAQESEIPPMIFLSNVEGDFDIYRMEDGEVSLILDTEEDEYAPAVSPDGTRIAFLQIVEGDPEIFVMDIDGSNIRRLTERVGFDELS